MIAVQIAFRVCQCAICRDFDPQKHQHIAPHGFGMPFCTGIIDIHILLA